MTTWADTIGPPSSGKSPDPMSKSETAKRMEALTVAYYAIMTTGTGKRARYTIRRFMGSTCSAPIGDIYTSEEAARSAADAMGLEIKACGDCWRVLLMT